MGTVKQLIGERRQTIEYICLVVSAIPSVQSLIMKQRCFLQKITSHADFNLTPLRKALDLAIAVNSTMGAYYQRTLAPINVQLMRSMMTCRRGKEELQTLTRFVTYRLITPKLVEHPLYTKPSQFISTIITE